MAIPSFLSVVIPTHNTREMTIACVESVISEADPWVEVLVVDDRSQDGTSEALESRFSIEVIRLEESGGFTRAANLGLARAQGDLLLLLNSDTLVGASCFDAIRRAMEAEPALGVVGARLTYPDGRPQWSGGSEPGLLWLFVLGSGLPELLARIPGYRKLRRISGFSGGSVDWVTGAAMAIRRDAWSRVGPLDESFGFYCQDLDFCVRLREEGWNIRIDPHFKVVHAHGATISSKKGVEGRAHTETLWVDLIRWAWKSRGQAWARKARWSLCLGARVRIAMRQAAGLFMASASRRAWRMSTCNYERALAMIEDLTLPDEKSDPTAWRP